MITVYLNSVLWILPKGRTYIYRLQQGAGCQNSWVLLPSKPVCAWCSAEWRVPSPNSSHGLLKDQEKLQTLNSGELRINSVPGCVWWPQREYGEVDKRWNPGSKTRTRQQSLLAMLGWKAVSHKGVHSSDVQHLCSQELCLPMAEWCYCTALHCALLCTPLWPSCRWHNWVYCDLRCIT